MPHIIANFASDLSEAGPAMPTCTGSVMPRARELAVPGDERCRVEAELAHDVDPRAGLRAHRPACARARPRARRAGNVRVALRVARDADRLDAGRGERARLEHLERARVLARGRRLVAGHEQRAARRRLPAVARARARAPRARRCAARRCAGSRETRRARRRRRLPRRPRSSRSACARRRAWSRPAGGPPSEAGQLAVGRGDLERGARRERGDALLEAAPASSRDPAYFCRRVTTKVSSLNQRPPCFCSTSCVASR